MPMVDWHGQPCDDGCPVRRAMDVLDGRWTLLVVRDLLPGPRRFNELLNGIDRISPKVLIERLKLLEAKAVIVRTVYPETPVRIEYALTELGRELMPVVEALATWGQRLAEAQPGDGIATGAGGVDGHSESTV